MKNDAVPSAPAPSAPQDTVPATSDGAQSAPVNAPPPDAPRKEVILYAFGNIEASVADQFFNVLNSVMIVAMHVNPMLLGLVLGIKTLWDSITDPIMAYITDNTRSRWGRRRPYILVGGVSRIALLVLIVAFLPTGTHLSDNHLMEAQKFAQEGIKEAGDSRKLATEAITLWNEGRLTEAAFQESLQRALTGAERAESLLMQHRPFLENEHNLRVEEEHALRNKLEQTLQESDVGTKREAAEGLLKAAETKRARSAKLLTDIDNARRSAVAARHLGNHGLALLDSQTSSELRDASLVQARADEELRTLGLEPIDLLTGEEKEPPPLSAASPGMWASLASGWNAYFAPENAAQRTLVVYVLIAVLLFTTLTTVQSVPYYALGIELCPSYNGRTQVVVYRSVMNQIAGLLAPWIPVLCFSLLFAHALQGLFWVAVFACVIGIPSTILMCWFVRERTEVRVVKGPERTGIFRSIFEVANNAHFLRICGLYCFIGLTNGVFAQLGFFLNVYWIMGSALSGATLGAWVSMVAWGLGLLSLPLINWGCRKFQKHRMLQLALVWMAIGTALNWWAMNPDHPEYQFILPFFFSVGISSVYTILPTMMADVTDVDELRHGVRREGMFGAVMAFLMKIIGAFTPILAGAVLVFSGFRPEMEYEQTAETILNMRLMYSFVPAGLLLFALILLWRYPLTREKVAEIKELLHQRHAKAEA